MPIFEYEALNAAGKNIRGIIDADSARTARTKPRLLKSATCSRVSSALTALSQRERVAGLIPSAESSER